MYFSQSLNVFFSIAKCIFPNWKMYFSKILNIFDQIGPQTVPLYCPGLPCSCAQPLHIANPKKHWQKQSTIMCHSRICFHSGVSHVHFVLGGLFDAMFVKFLQNPFGVYEHLSHAKPIFLTAEGKTAKPIAIPSASICAAKFHFLAQNSLSFLA